MNNNICIIGYYGYGNFGDDLMVKVLTEYFLGLKGTQVTVISRNKLAFLDDNVAQIIIESKISFLDYIKIFSSFDYVVWGGGTCLYTSNNNTRGLVGVAKRVLASKLGKSKFNFCSIGIEKTNNLLGELLFRVILSLSNNVLVRDENSKSVLNSLGMKGDIGCDITYMLTDAKLNVSSENYIGFYAAGYRDSYENIEKIADLLINVSKFYNKKILLISLHDGLDDSYNIELESVISNKGIVSRHNAHSIDERLSVLKNAYFNIGMRLHSVILSDVLDVPVFAISYQDKVKDYLKTIDIFEKSRHYEIDEEYELTVLTISIGEQLNKKTQLQNLISSRKNKLLDIINDSVGK